jgi:UDP-N-acetylglucosamine 2-epimerase (non-hydrolysing)
VTKKSILLVFGTRPEAIKCFPVVNALRRRPDEFSVKVCVTGQHRQLLDQVLALSDITPDADLDLMIPDQTLAQLSSRAVDKLDAVLSAERPDWLFVQGDTSTAMCAGLAAYYNKVAVGHIEAGLRSGNIYSPWPEEVNRKVISNIAALNFAPTAAARDNLLAENVAPGSIRITGNTVIDALQFARDALETRRDLAQYLGELPSLDPDKKTILVTTHRRESFGAGLQGICGAIAQLADRPDVEVVLPVHPNPNVREVVYRRLGEKPNVHLTGPLDYLPFVWLMNRAHLALTDSGGVQEEAPSLGTPVLVLRDTTERPEGIAAGNAKLVGTDEARIFSEATRLLDNADLRRTMQIAANPYGDGKAAERIVEAIASA